MHGTSFFSFLRYKPCTKESFLKAGTKKHCMGVDSWRKAFVTLSVGDGLFGWPTWHEDVVLLV